jgi:hypothetical protein
VDEVSAGQAESPPLGQAESALGQAESSLLGQAESADLPAAARPKSRDTMEKRIFMDLVLLGFAWLGLTCVEKCVGMNVVEQALY